MPLLVVEPLPTVLLDASLELLLFGMVVVVLIGLLLLPIDIGLATLSTINCGLLMPSLDGSIVLELLLIV